MSNVDLSEASTEIMHIGAMTKKCPYCGSVYTNKRKHFVVCPNRAHGQHRWTEEEKHRQSEKRKEFLRNNPDKHPWRMHRYDKFVSKPCEYLKNKLRELNIEFEEEVVMPKIGRNFSIDIFIPKLKMGIEVNGNQHYDSCGQLTPYYQERHDIIEQGGIKLIELPYTSCYHEETLESIELLWRNWNLNCLLNSKICEFESRQQYYVMKRAELKRCKDAEVKVRYDAARREGKVNSRGIIQSNKTSISQWNKYKALIEESNVDITKFGWVKKVSQITGSTIFSSKQGNSMQNTDFIDNLSAKLSDGVQPALDMVVENILNESDFAKYGNDEEDVYYKYSVLLRASGFRQNEFENELRASVSAASDIAITSNSKKGKALDREALLCEVIEYLAKEYYNGHEKASDDAYDGLVVELRSINPKNPLAAGGLAAADDTGRKKFQHYLITGTQQKYANMEAFAEEWFPQYGGKHRLMLNGKCDGAGSEVMYQDGHIIQAISRGDGFQGEDITQSALKWKGLIHEIPNFTGSIRGEFMLKESVFIEKYSQLKKTARNASAGISKRLDGSGSEDMSFVAYDVLNRAPTQFKTELEKMQWLESCGFEVPMYELVDTIEQIEAFREKVFESRKKSIDYGCDGIVVKINDIDYEDLRRKTPMTQCAIKFKLETAETTLIGIEWSCKGRYLSPVAILTPTELDGVTVERASLSNLNKMMQMGIQIGCKVQISRHGEVIPQVDKVV